MSGLVEAGSYTNSLDAGVARSLLEAEGIHAVIFDHGFSSVEGLPNLIPIRLMVLDDDLDGAQALLGSGAADEAVAPGPVRLRGRGGAWLALVAMLGPLAFAPLLLSLFWSASRQWDWRKRRTGPKS